MALANVSLSDTFTLWLARFNQLLSIGNAITEGQANTTGTLTISNPNYLNGKDRKSTRLNSSHVSESRMPSSA